MQRVSVSLPAAGSQATPTIELLRDLSPRPEGGLAAATLVATPGGPRAAGDLRLGDQVVSPAGVARIARLRRLVAPGWLDGPSAGVSPVLVRPGALGGLGPDRALTLLAGTTIALPDRAPLALRWWIDGARVVRLPPAAPAEFVDVTLDPAGAVLCGGIAIGGPAQPRPAVPPVLPDAGPGGRLLGNIERIDHGGMAGWVHDPARPDAPVAFQVLARGETLGLVLADAFRDDLERARIGGGWCGFQIRFTPPLPDELPVLIGLPVPGPAGAPSRHPPGTPVLIDRVLPLNAAFMHLLQTPNGLDAERAAEVLRTLLQERAVWSIDRA